MNCPTCHALIGDDCWTAAPPLPSGAGAPPSPPPQGRPADPQSTHTIILYCHFCELAAEVTVRSVNGRVQILSVRNFANAADVKRLLRRLPGGGRGAGIRFLGKHHSKPGVFDAGEVTCDRSRLDHVGDGDGGIRGDGRVDDGRAEPDTTPAALTPADDASARAGRPRPSRQEVGTAGPRPAGGGGVTR